MALTVAVDGLVLGSFFALLALGFAAVYGVLGEANLAYGDAVVLATLCAVAVDAHTGTLALGILAGVGAGAALLLLTEVVALRPLRSRGDALSPVMTTVGIALILRNVGQQAFGSEGSRVPPFFGSAHTSVAGTSVDSTTAACAAMLLAAAAGGAIALRRLDWGRAVRAVRLDPLGARLVGIPVGRVIAVLYAVCGVVGALAAMARLAHLGGVDVQDGFRFTLVAFAAAAIGGGRSLGWAVAGGYLLGVTSAVTTRIVGEPWTPAAQLGVLVAVLVVRPQGLARAPIAARA